MVWLKDNRIEALNFKIVEVDKQAKASSSPSNSYCSVSFSLRNFI